MHQKTDCLTLPVFTFRATTFGGHLRSGWSREFITPVSSTHRMSWGSKKRSTTFCSAEHVPSSWSDQQGKAKRFAWQFLSFKETLANVTGTPALNLEKHFEQTSVFLNSTQFYAIIDLLSPSYYRQKISNTKFL